MKNDIIVPILTAILGGLAVHVFDYFMGRKREIEQHQRERKEDQYKKFLENLIGFFEGWEDKDDRKRNFMEELYTHAPLYASTEVIKIANKYVESFTNKKLTSEERDKIANKLVISIREEMGIDKKHPLKENDVRRYKLD